jgi:hypothetical protein
MKIVLALSLIMVIITGAAACAPQTLSPAPSQAALPLPAEFQAPVPEAAAPFTEAHPDTPEALTSISVSPSPGAYLTNSESVSSGVLLLDVQVNPGISGKQYISPWYPAHKVNAGDSVLVVSGSIQNKHRENKEIAMYAEGYDAAGKQVAWTLDAAHIAGQIGLHLEKEAAGRFTLHLNPAENIRSIRILANNYSITPP